MSTKRARSPESSNAGPSKKQKVDSATEDKHEEDRYEEPSAETLEAPATPELVASAKRWFEGKWKFLRDESTPLGPVLAAEGVNFLLRKLTDSLSPTVETTVTAEALTTKIVTGVSTELSVSKIDGTRTEWFSAGRGNLSSQVCLMEGGRCLYGRTVIPPEPEQSVAVEHKWIHVDPSGERFVEVYQYHPDGVPNTKTVSCRRVFVRIHDPNAAAPPVATR